METKKNNKMLILGIVGLLSLFLVIGVSYAVWSLLLKQTGENIVNTSCFKVEFSDLNPIELNKAYPITDNDGKKLTPYEFTIKNTCENYASFQINLEILDTTTLEDLSIIKIDLEGEISLLTSKESTSKTLSNATTSYKLQTGYLNANESKTFHLRLWMNEGTPPNEEYMNKVFKSKVTVITSYLNEKPKTVAEQNLEYILSKKVDGQIIEDDETVDHNLRYIGANPNNYVSFNNELWRIIGAMNNIDDGTGKKETRIKIIRNESIGEYSWDSSDMDVNSGYGANEWSEADAMKLLNPNYESNQDLDSSGNKITVNNSLYWNRESGICYNGSSNATTACDFTSTGLTDEAKKLIGEAVWNLGSNGTTPSNIIKTLDYYEFERSENSSKICTSGDYCNDDIERTTKWKGIIGLMYPSDYGYATGGGSTTERTTCLNTVLWDWENESINDCKNNDWIYKSGMYQWTNISLSYATSARYVLSVFDVGKIYGDLTSNTYNILPATYLNSNVKITSGEGTEESPFILSLEA